MPRQPKRIRESAGTTRRCARGKKSAPRPRPLLPTWMLRVANSTPIVDLDSRENSLRVKRLSRLDLPTPLSPISTTLNR